MKTKNKPHFLLMAGIVAVFAAFTVSCNKDDDPSLADLREDKLQYLEDSLRISDSLKRINAAGVVNYAISVVNGSTSTLFSNAANPGREQKTQNALDGAIVTISQYGKTATDTTDASGMVVFTGFFRSSVNVTVRKEGFTTVAYAAAVNLNTATSNNTISFIGNIIPVFELTGANTATITGRATIETNLTNKTRENVADGTKVTASIDAKDPLFATRFLTTGVDNFYDAPSGCGCQILDMGEILQASYQTGVIGSVTAGNYTLTVPAAIDGLPLSLSYSEIAADQTLFETAGLIAGDRSETYRTLFIPGTVVGSLSTVPAGAGVTVNFDFKETAATLGAVVTSTTNGGLNNINVTNGGANYSGTPNVRITGGGGNGAAATAVVTNGRVTAVNLTSPGTGYTTNPTVTLLDGDGNAGASVTNLAQDGTVISIVVTNSGSGYTTAPTVTVTAPTGTTSPVTATATANVSNGRITSISITNAGFSYLANPTVTIGAPAAGGVQATADAFFSGRSISDVQITNPGAEYSFAPAVIFGLPTVANGVRAQGTATVNPVTGQVVGITITNPGMGYTGVPTVTLQPFTTAATTENFLSGGAVTAIPVTAAGAGYVGVPGVTITGSGTGATATAIVVEGKVVGINITNGGSGYAGAVSATLVDGDGATAYATVVNGAITAVTVADGGRFYTGAPRVRFGSTPGGGAAATATVTPAGAISAVTVTAGGSGYLEGNVPTSAQIFSSTKGATIQSKPGVAFINDIYYGTGVRQPK